MLCDFHFWPLLLSHKTIKCGIYSLPDLVILCGSHFKKIAQTKHTDSCHVWVCLWCRETFFNFSFSVCHCPYFDGCVCVGRKQGKRTRSDKKGKKTQEQRRMRWENTEPKVNPLCNWYGANANVNMNTNTRAHLICREKTRQWNEAVYSDTV